MSVTSIFIDALLSPTYHFAGLGYGNVHSINNQSLISYPKKAALEALEKVRVVLDYGQRQFLFPCYSRPVLSFIRDLGFHGDDQRILKDCFSQQPQLFSAVFSGASAWVANAFIWTPSCDSFDQRVHITPANLTHCFHRSLDVSYTQYLLDRVVLNHSHYCLHAPIANSFSDEGAANMVRLSSSDKGFYLFVHGSLSGHCQMFQGRQSRMAQEWIMRSHCLDGHYCMFIEQSQQAIDAGVFHNDVICFGAETVLVLHEYAFSQQTSLLEQLQERFFDLYQRSLEIVVISESMLSLDLAVSSYFFNSQLILLDTNHFLLLCPKSCKDNDAVQSCLAYIRAQSSYQWTTVYVELEESLKNGGGPACLRGMGMVTSQEYSLLSSEYLMSLSKLNRLMAFVSDHYPDELCLDSLTHLETVHFMQSIVKKANECIVYDGSL